MQACVWEEASMPATACLAVAALCPLMLLCPAWALPSGPSAVTPRTPPHHRPPPPPPGDWDKAWEIFETEYPIDGDDMPELMDIMSLDPEAQEKAARRQRELDLQEEAARRHIRIVDDLGRAYATGKRKTSIARVWIWQGNGAWQQRSCRGRWLCRGEGLRPQLTAPACMRPCPLHTHVQLGAPPHAQP